MLYFARMREAIGTAAERVEPPGEIVTLAQLVDWFAARGEGYAAAFADRARLRAAIDGEMAGLDASIADAREIALFPPVTGG